MQPVLSIVTGTRNRPAGLQRLLESIQRYTDVPWELIIADASDVAISSDGFPSNIRVIPERPRLGMSRGYNAAFAQAVGKFVLWLNDDCEVTPRYASAAVRFMEAHPQIGLGALHYSENGGEFHVNSNWGCTYANFGILPKWLGDNVGYFDGDIEMYGSDNSLCFKVLLSGSGVADIPDSRVLHHSVHDALRVENQQNRLRDNHTLTTRYIPTKPQWLATFNRLKVGGGIPWSHGVNPNATVRMVKR